MDALIKERLKRANKEPKGETQDEKKEPKSAKAKTDNLTDEKISALETKLLCFEKDIAKDSMKDALALAKAYVTDEVDISKALDLVLEKYPSLAKSRQKPDTTGTNSKGDGTKMDGVEAEFLKRNPSQAKTIRTSLKSIIFIT